MPPKKNCKKSQLKTMELTPKRNLRNRMSKPLMGGQTKIPSADDLTTPPNDTLDAEEAPKKEVPQKTTRTKLSHNNININGILIKPIKTNEVTEVECNKPDSVATRFTRFKAACKQNQNEVKITPVDEATKGPCLEEVVPLTNDNDKSIDEDCLKKLICGKKATNARSPKVKAAPRSVKRTQAAYKQAQSEMKVMLANEVIRSAFQKKQIIVPSPSRPHRTKRVSIKLRSLMEDYDRKPDVAKKKIVKRVCNRKRPAQLKLQEDPQHNDVKSDPPVEEEIPRKKRKLSHNRKTIEKSANNKVKDIEGKAQASEPAVDDASILNSNESAAAAACDDNSETQSKKPNNVSCRKYSSTSSSTVFSWTKDISSSSTTTCVTVKSSDFLRIDKKLPIVKLTNVDNRMRRKDSNDNIFEDNSSDSPQKTPKSPAGSSSVAIADLNVSQTLNLSTSSLTSVVSNRPDINSNATNKENTDVVMDKLKQSLENLSSKMKNLDVEMINWIGYENESQEDSRRNINSQIFKLFHEESEVIKYCKEIKRVLVGSKYDQSSEVIEECIDNIGETPPDPNDNSLKNELHKDVTDNCDNQRRNTHKEDVESEKDKVTEIVSEREDIFNERKSFDKDIDGQDNDDDDALSLFAESITGFESFRKSSYFTSPRFNDRSITHTISRESFEQNERLSSPPDNVDETGRPAYNQVKLNVERQRADSSSVKNITKDNCVIAKSPMNNIRPVFEYISDRFNVQSLDANTNNSFKQTQNVNSTDAVDFNKSLTEFPATLVRSVGDAFQNASNSTSEFQNYAERTLENFSNTGNASEDLSAKSFENWNKRTYDSEINTNKESFSETQSFAVPNVEKFKQATMQPFGMANKPTAGDSIFNGVCLFYLISSCKNKCCNFPHKNIEVDFVRAKLQTMSEEMFIRESMYLFKWKFLQKKYGMCFIDESIRRNLTIWLLQLVKHFIPKTISKYRKNATLIIEMIEATLLHLNNVDMQPYVDFLRLKTRPNSCMCDDFMKIISETQNFSRFKDVFIKLASFMSNIGRLFPLDVATQLLERLCILPYDEALAHTLINIIEKTSPNIFKTPMMGLLENQLSKNNVGLFEKLMSLKLQFEGINQLVMTPRIASSNPGYHTSTPLPRADSPDTTNMDSMNKTTEPVITRTITINRTFKTSSLNRSVGSDSSEEAAKRYTVQKHEQTWRNCPRNFASVRPQRQVHKQLPFLPWGSAGTPPQFHRKLPQDPY